ncbi:MAG: PTS mannose/fructose/sorbose/N-acetylgalactosamine transporter subunit IIC [Lachnospiraceae bacterium]
MPVFLQDILVIVLSGYMLYDHGTGRQLVGREPVMIAILMGLIMGDLQTALIIGGTLQLMSLGVAGMGGASVPEYGMAAMVGIFLAARNGLDTGTAVTVGLPVGMLGMQLDVLVKMLNNVWAHMEKKYLHERNYKKMQLVFLLSIFTFALKYMVPVTVVVFFGPAIVEVILNVLPTWFLSGLSVAGGMLPVVGICMLMNFMPLKKYFSFIIAGFVFSAYLGLPILGVAFLGGAAAYYIYLSNSKNVGSQYAVAADGAGGDDYDE